MEGPCSRADSLASRRSNRRAFLTTGLCGELSGY